MWLEFGCPDGPSQLGAAMMRWWWCALVVAGGGDVLFTEDELEVYDGVRREAIYLAYGGEVFDVTLGRQFYGPGMAYAKFAGRACTRGPVERAHLCGT